MNQLSFNPISNSFTQWAWRFVHCYPRLFRCKMVIKMKRQLFCKPIRHWKISFWHKKTCEIRRQNSNNKFLDKTKNFLCRKKNYFIKKLCQKICTFGLSSQDSAGSPAVQSVKSGSRPVEWETQLALFEYLSIAQRSPNHILSTPARLHSLKCVDTINCSSLFLVLK